MSRRSADSKPASKPKGKVIEVGLLVSLPSTIADAADAAASATASCRRRRRLLLLLLLSALTSAVVVGSGGAMVVVCGSILCRQGLGFGDGACGLWLKRGQ